MMFSDHPLVPLLFLLVAVLYSSVGFGGGSGYLAILSQISPDQGFIRATSYVCNIGVTALNSIRHKKAKWLNWKDTWPWLIASIPMAYMGGAYRFEDRMFYVLLGVSLLVSALLIFVRDRFDFKPTKVFDQLIPKIILGGGIGLLAGLVGIGGGIFLSPILHLSKWRSGEGIASISSIFILVNASAGAVGFFLNQTVEFNWGSTLLLLGAVLIGSWIGTSFSISSTGTRLIRYITGILVLIVGVRLLFANL